jgi:hypothetical protein
MSNQKKIREIFLFYLLLFRKLKDAKLKDVMKMPTIKCTASNRSKMLNSVVPIQAKVCSCE